LGCIGSYILKAFKENTGGTPLIYVKKGTILDFLIKKKLILGPAGTF
jgi:hypothetical protein